MCEQTLRSIVIMRKTEKHFFLCMKLNRDNSESNEGEYTTKAVHWYIKPPVSGNSAIITTYTRNTALSKPLKYFGYSSIRCVRLFEITDLGRVRLGSIRNKNNWNNASKRLFGSYSHSGIPGFHSGHSAPRRDRKSVV